MKIEELIELAKRLSEKENLSDDKDDLRFLKREYRRLNDKEEESFYEVQLTNEFNKYYELIVKKVPDLSKNGYDEKKELINKAKELLNQEGIKDLSKNLNDILTQFKRSEKGSKEQEDELWNEMRAVKEEINKKIDTYFENQRNVFLDRQKQKELLIEETKKAVELENIKNAGNKLDEIMEQWKKIGYAGKGKEDELWEQFSGLRKIFNEKRKQHAEDMKKIFQERADKKEEIIKTVKKITADAYFSDEEVIQIKNIRNNWKNIGFAGKEKDDDLYQRFNDAIKQYFDEMKFYK